MLRKLKNNTASPVVIVDTGDTVPASGEFIITPLDYGKYEGSADTILFLSDQSISATVSTLTANDGTFDLAIEKGVRMIQGGWCRPIVDFDDPSIGAKVRVDGTLVTDPIDLGDPVGGLAGVATTTPGLVQTLNSFTVGAGKTRILANIKVSCFLGGTWVAYADSAIIGSGRCGSGSYDSGLDFLPRQRLAESVLFELKFTQRAGTPATPPTDVHFSVGACEI
jgi:hypothetical protein